MAQGIPLTDEDRWPWLDAVGAWMEPRDERGGGVFGAASRIP